MRPHFLNFGQLEVKVEGCRQDYFFSRRLSGLSFRGFSHGGCLGRESRGRERERGQPLTRDKEKNEASLGHDRMQYIITSSFHAVAELDVGFT